jgi:hypothetical protein
VPLRGEVNTVMMIDVVMRGGIDQAMKCLSALKSWKFRR